MAIVRSLDSGCNPQKTTTTDDHKNDKPEGQKNEKSIFVIWDSMVRHLNGWEMSKKLNANFKVFPDYFILNVGTNDLSSDKSSEEIARWIIDPATSIKSESMMLAHLTS